MLTIDVPIWNGGDAQDLIDVKAINADLFQARASYKNFGGTIFGGQIIAQALASAYETVKDDLIVHALHATFLEAGIAGRSIEYHVSRIRDGRSTAYRRVSAFQEEACIFELSISYTKMRTGPAHNTEIPTNIPHPDNCIDVVDYVASISSLIPTAARETYGVRRPIERRIINPEASFLHLGPAERNIWLRLNGAENISNIRHQHCLIAFLSDAWLFGVSLMPHVVMGQSPEILQVSLNHSMWLHSTAGAGDWLLLATESPWAGSGRGIGRGLIYSLRGELIATVSQEGAVIGTLKTT